MYRQFKELPILTVCDGLLIGDSALKLQSILPIRPTDDFGPLEMQPVLPLIRWRSAERALSLANRTLL